MVDQLVLSIMSIFPSIVSPLLSSWHQKLSSPVPYSVPFPNPYYKPATHPSFWPSDSQWQSVYVPGHTRHIFAAVHFHSRSLSVSRPIPTGPSSATIASSSHLGDDSKSPPHPSPSRDYSVIFPTVSRSIGTLQSNLVPSTAPTSVVAPSFTSTLVHRLFEGVLTSETRCLTCETVSSRDESFLDLSIDIEQNSSVTACLRQFSASEMLCQKNKFFCDSCCDLQEAEKS